MDTEYSHPKLTEVLLGDPCREYHRWKDSTQYLPILGYFHRFGFRHSLLGAIFYALTRDDPMAIPAHFIHVLQDWKPTALLYAFGYILKRMDKLCEILYKIGELMEEISTKIDDLEIETIKFTKKRRF